MSPLQDSNYKHDGKQVKSLHINGTELTLCTCFIISFPSISYHYEIIQTKQVTEDRELGE